MSILVIDSQVLGGVLFLCGVWMIGRYYAIYQASKSEPEGVDEKVDRYNAGFVRIDYDEEKA